MKKDKNENILGISAHFPLGIVPCGMGMILNAQGHVEEREKYHAGDLNTLMVIREYKE